MCWGGFSGAVSLSSKGLGRRIVAVIGADFGGLSSRRLLVQGFG